MRTRTIQYLYMQRPLITLIIIAVLTTLCWIGMGDFYTKGEPREASVALSMLEEGNWTLPYVYADEFAYKPPLTHWMMAVFSLPKGEVTPFTSRLPSAISFIGLIIVSFVLFGRKLKFQEAFLACLILLSSFELHRAAMTTRVDMMLTFLIVLGLLCLYKWEVRKRLSGFPFVIPVVLGLAALTKGPIGIILPLLVFGIYLLLLRYNFWKIFGKLALVAVCSMILPVIWYILAYQKGGQEFLDLIWAENFGHFFSFGNLHIKYSLGHDEPFWFNFITLSNGFIPWTILLLISLFSIRFTLKIPGVKTIWNNILSMEKVKLFSLVAAVVIIVFYCIPLSKRSAYLMPAYPFIAIFLSQLILYLTEHRPTVNRIFSLFIGSLGVIVALICLLTIVTRFVDPVQLTGQFTHSERTLGDVATIWNSLNKPQLLYVIPICGLLLSLYVLFYRLSQKNNIKILYATIGVYMCIYLVADSIFIPAYKNGISIKPVAEQLKRDFSIDKNHPVYVMSNLLEYGNMYGLNFYLGNHFLNFEKEMPKEGFFLTGKNSFEKVLSRYGDRYQFQLLREVNNRNRDGEKIIQLYTFNNIEFYE